MPATTYSHRRFRARLAVLAVALPLALGGCIAYDAGGYAPGYAGGGYYGGYGGGVSVYAPSYYRGGYGGHGEYHRGPYGVDQHHGGEHHGGGRSDTPYHHPDRRYSNRD